MRIQLSPTAAATPVPKKIGNRASYSSPDCPVDVEMTVRRQGKRLIVHLLNYANYTTVSGVSLRVTGDAPARVFNPTRPDQDVALHDAGDGVRFTVPDFDNHTMFVIQPR